MRYAETPKRDKIVKATKLNQSVRFEAATREELQAVADLAGLTPADVVRICVREGLPIVRASFEAMRQRFAALRPPGTGFVSTEPPSQSPAPISSTARPASSKEARPTPGKGTR